MSHHYHKPSWQDSSRWTIPAGADDTQAGVDPLERMPFFATLRPDDRRALGALGVLRSYPEGATLAQEGQRSEVGLFIVMRGCVRLTQQSASDGVRPLALLGPGEMFGELALLDEQPRSATATAIAPTLAFIIPIVDFRAVLQHNPEAAASLLAQISRRIRTAEVSQVR